MPNLSQCRSILRKGGIELSDSKLGHLMDILSYLANRACDQIQSEPRRGPLTGIQLAFSAILSRIWREIDMSLGRNVAVCIEDIPFVDIA
jgi:hypothetical protein